MSILEISCRNMPEALAAPGQIIRAIRESGYNTARVIFPGSSDDWLVHINNIAAWNSIITEDLVAAQTRSFLLNIQLKE
ncbi:MAG: hypothetical protein ABIP54_00550, partial [Candidatus Andersenbacteria bacterium]